MPVNIGVSVNDREVRDLLGRALDLTGDLRRPLSEFGLWMVRDAGRKLRARTAQSDDSTGRLRASLTFQATNQQVTIGSNLRYAAVQQLGHDNIKARPPLKRIAIPLLPHLRRRNIWPRDLPRGLLRLVITDSGAVLLMGPEDEQGNVVGGRRKPWYLLVRQVKVPARPYIVFSKQAWAFLRRRLIRHLGLQG